MAKPSDTAENDYDLINKDEKKQITKFDKEVDDKQYVETPKIKEEIILQQAKMQKDKQHREKIRIKEQLKKEQLSVGPRKRNTLTGSLDVGARRASKRSLFLASST